ncbi:MAG: hypothetical protein ACOYBH_04195 [Candidatus Alectryocaccobium sp.]|jgi:DNA-binding MarR family transcriptional regulator|nr:hypothetical protein [Candidatus Alectryocaccobium sp.]
MADYRHEIDELKKLSDKVIFARAELNLDRLENVFSEMSLIDYELIRKIWPQLRDDENCATKTIYLQEMQEKTGIPMNQISKAIQKLSDRNLIDWKRGESGTYIEINQFGRNKFKDQQLRLLDYFDRVVERMGFERLNEMVSVLNEVEYIMKDEADKLD